MTFLELCQEVAKDSGTVPGDSKPQSVLGNSGRLASIVAWTNEAYDRIQIESDHWRWLTTEFEAPLVSGSQRYTATSLAITSRFSHWMPEKEGSESGFTIWNTDIGRSGEGSLCYLNWPEFRRAFLRGDAASNTGTPAYFAIDDSDRIVVHPTPSGNFKIAGSYYKSPQSLTENSDIPEMPARFHRLIKWEALVQLVIFDEAPEQLDLWTRYRDRMLSDMRGQQYRRMRIAGPLA